MRNFSLSPQEMVASLWRHRVLVGLMIQREVVGRYRGAYLGILWSFFHPLLMLLIYTFVFSVVFKARWHAGSDSKTEFALVLFAGLMVFNLFAECINRAPGLVIANVNYVKKVVFPLEVLPWIVLGSALIHTSISLVVWLAVYVIFFGWPQVTVLLLPFALVPLIFLVMGLSWFLASLGVYLRDAAQITSILTTVLMFLSPIFYPASALPENFRKWIYFNPLTPVIETMRDVLYWGHLSHIVAWVSMLFVSMITAWLGFAWFQKTRKGFADVL
ncbi:ABC transporter permease [Ferrovum sp.]|uniref:ABC transporter permease n=1 Tax=Ferrovum sp. TaxID=2609467 RepID=UPI002603309D|nr:ABC transporter permease [Ferrovum sp.]